MLPTRVSQRPQTLVSLQIIWIALLAGPVAFLVVILSGLIPEPASGPPQPQPILTWVCVGMLLLEVPVTYVIRLMVFRTGRIDGRIRLNRYSTGNIIFWAGCEGVAFFGIVAAFVNHRSAPTLPVVLIALAFEVLTVPRRSQVVLPGDE